MKKNRPFKVAAGAMLLAAGAAAQTADVLLTAPAVPAPREAVVMHRRVGTIGGTTSMAGVAGANFEYVSAEMGIEGQIVKAAPYSAEAVTESVQVLGDRNRISRKNSTALFRDGEGRTRRELSLNTIGPWAAASGAATQIIIIHDPVAGASYTLDEKTKTARKVVGRGMAVSYTRALPAPAPGVQVAPLPPLPPLPPPGPQITMSVPAIAIRAPGAQDPNSKTEALGKQNIEGVIAEGTRTTMTIPAGQIGNERPIEVVSERWFSPELQTVVMTRNNNPMSGESTYKLTNIRRGEPSKMLFEVPSDYTIKTDQPYTIKTDQPPAMRMRSPQE
jgi:hypothetical protein